MRENEQTTSHVNQHKASLSTTGSRNEDGRVSSPVDDLPNTDFLVENGTLVFPGDHESTIWRRTRFPIDDDYGEDSGVVDPALLTPIEAPAPAPAHTVLSALESALLSLGTSSTIAVDPTEREQLLYQEVNPPPPLFEYHMPWVCENCRAIGRQSIDCTTCYQPSVFEVIDEALRVVNFPAGETNEDRDLTFEYQ